eukprot:352209-Chlamydomonas_euryale.AAC.1
MPLVTSPPFCVALSDRHRHCNRTRPDRVRTAAAQHGGLAKRFRGICGAGSGRRHAGGERRAKRRGTLLLEGGWGQRWVRVRACWRGHGRGVAATLLKDEAMLKLR